ncbi:HD-GYP domain-containing protein [Gemmatimonadota bacterium]
MDKETMMSSSGSDLYEILLDHIRDQTESVGRGDLVTLTDTIELAQRLIEDINTSSGLLETAMSYYEPADYAISHAANVAIYALKMAMDMGLPMSDVEDTVIAGILHDIGLGRIPGRGNIDQGDSVSADNPDKVLLEQYQQIVELHSQYGHDAIAPVDERSERIADYILQHHEKADGSGYPNGLLESEQHVPSRILSILDTYEALIHPRPFRDALLPPMGIEAIKSQAVGVYSTEMLKELIFSFAVYPVGHFVGFEDGHIGKVVETHRANPCRPLVELLFDQKGDRIDPPRRLDLRENHLMQIIEILPRFKPQM